MAFGENPFLKMTPKTICTDKTTLKCDKEFDGKGGGAQKEKEKRRGEDG